MCNPADAIEQGGDAAGNTAETLNHPTSEALDKTVQPVGDNELVQNIFKGVVMYYLGAGAMNAMGGAAAGGGGEGATATTGESTGSSTLTGDAGSDQLATQAGAVPGPGGEPLMPPATPEPTDPTAAGKTLGGGDVLGTLKTLAPVISAGSAIVSAMSAAAQANAAKDRANQNTALTVPTPPQSPIDPDLTALRKKNALLFGLDSPSSTDLTKGGAGESNLGRVTLLGGSSRLSA